MGKQLQIPVVFIVFNRPEVTRRSFEAIRRVQPSRLLIVADGPRASRLAEPKLCDEVLAIARQVDWPCQVTENVSPRNMGCRDRVSSGLTWAFGQVEQAIILEDDCLATPDFFNFCAELLDRYRDDPRVMMISGDKLYPHANAVTDSYYFSRFGHIWGWATWRRAWNSYDVKIREWPEFKKKALLRKIFTRSHLARAWENTFEQMYRGEIDTWDHQWTFNLLNHDGLSIQPTRNLVSNLGFGPQATHTQAPSALSEKATEALAWPLKHPIVIAPIQEIDERVQLESHPWLKSQIKALLRFVK